MSYHPDQKMFIRIWLMVSVSLVTIVFLMVSCAINESYLIKKCIAEKGGRDCASISRGPIE